jgi:hypothetical protein
MLLKTCYIFARGRIVLLALKLLRSFGFILFIVRLIVEAMFWNGGLTKGFIMPATFGTFVPPVFA